VPPEDDTRVRFHFGRDGFAFGTMDGKNEIRFHGTFHFDGHAYVGDGPLPNDVFLIRRARPTVDATLFGVFDLRLMAELAPNQPTLLDGWVDVHPWKWLRFRAGKFRSPFGLEFLQSDSQTALVERSLVQDLIPLRDVGIMLYGDIANGTVSYAVAMLNGAADGANAPDVPLQTAKDYVGRIFLRPLKPIRRLTWMDLGFGMAASYGSPSGTAASPNLPSYKTTSLLPMFSYIVSTATPAVADATTVAAGDRWRLSPQLYWYLGPVALMSEYIVTSQRVERMGQAANISNRAWHVTLSFVLTMEHASYEGVEPKHPVDFHHWAFGAVELVARYSELRIDNNAFPVFADPAAAVRSARELAGGLNWVLTHNVKVMLMYEHTDFGGGAANGADRKPENGLLGRIQLTM